MAEPEINPAVWLKYGGKARQCPAGSIAFFELLNPSTVNFLCSTGTSPDGLSSSKNVKGSVGYMSLCVYECQLSRTVMSEPLAYSKVAPDSGNERIRLEESIHEWCQADRSSFDLLSSSSSNRDSWPYSCSLLAKMNNLLWAEFHQNQGTFRTLKNVNYVFQETSPILFQKKTLTISGQ